MNKRTIIDHLLPPGTPRRQLSARIINKVKGRDVPRAGMDYATWVRRVEPGTMIPVRIYEYEPLISIIVPAYNTPDKYLEPMVDSVMGQTYGKWELVLVDGSPSEERRAAIRRVAERDQRIRVVQGVLRPGTNTIVANTNVGITEAQGEFVAFMDHDDTLAPSALNEVVAVLQKERNVDVFYSDEDKLSDDGKHRSLPLFKPDWSPALLYTVNYVSHFNVVRRSLVEAVGRLREGFDGAQDYDFILRAVERKPVVYHIPKVLYHWRQAAGSTAIHPDQKEYVALPAVRALTEHARRSGFQAEVVPVEKMPTTYRYKYALVKEPRVYVHLVNGTAQDFERELRPRTAYTNYEVLDEDTNPSGLPDDAFLLFLDASLKPEHEDWLNELMSVVTQPGSGVTGGWIRTADTRTVETGYVLEGREAKPFFAGALPDTWYHNGHALWPRNLLMVSPRCMVVRAGDVRQAYGKIALAQEELLSLGFKLYAAGRLNTFWPYARLQATQAGTGASIKLSGDVPERDPYFSPNLSLRQGQLELSER